MKLNEFWKNNKTWIIVLLIFVGAYFVFQPVSRYGTSSYDMADMEYAASDGFASYSKSTGFAGGSRNYVPSPSYEEAAAYYPEEERKIEKTGYAQLEIEPRQYDSARLSLEGITSKYEGYYTSKNERKDLYGEKEYRTFTITLKVPVESFDAAIADLKNVADVKNLNINAYDMTTQYYDTKAYLDNYKKEKETLLQLYNKAIQIDDIIKIQERLSQVQSQIDSYQMQLNNIDRVTEYSTISVTLSEKRDAIEGFYEMTGLRQLWGNIMMSFDNVFVLISNLIGFVVVGLIVWLGYKGVRRIIRH